jgi:small subunit ribosomal protein S21
VVRLLYLWISTYLLDTRRESDLASTRFGAQGLGPDPREKGFSSISTDCLGVLQVLAEIKIQEGESIENALRRFKRKVQQEDIIKDIKKHSFYLKPGDKRRAKQALARKRNRKKIRRESE